MKIKRILSGICAMSLTFCAIPALEAQAEPLSITMGTKSDTSEPKGEIIAHEEWYIDSNGNLLPAESVLSEQDAESRELTDLFSATLYYTGIEDGNKHYKVGYVLSSLDPSRYYTSSTIYVTPKNSSSTHASRDTWSASEKRTTVQAEIEYWYTSNPPATPGATVSCAYYTTTGSGFIQPHYLDGAIDIS